MPSVLTARRAWLYLFVLLLPWGASLLPQAAYGQRAVLSVGSDSGSKAAQDPIDIGDVVAGESETVPVEFINPTSSDLEVIDAFIDAEVSDFSVPIIEPFIVPAGESFFLDITFSPSFIGEQQEILVLELFDLSNEQSFTNFFDLVGEGIPAVEANPLQVAFGEQVVGSTGARALQVINNASEPRFVGTTEIVGPDADAFRLSPDLIEVEIPALSALQTDVLFEPQRVGLHQATLRIFVSDQFVSLIEVSLSGTALEQQNPILSLSPLQIDFEDTDLGQEALATLTVANTGNADLDVTNLRIEGDHAADFALLGETSFIVPPEGERLVDVRFTPSARGLRTAAILVRSNGGNADVPLSGQGRAPEADVSPSVSFGDVPVGDARAQNLLIINRGDAPLSVSDLRLSGDAAFSITAGTPVPMIPAGGSHELEITFAPEDAGSASGSVLFSTNDPDQPSVDVTLQGQGTEALTQSTQALRFGDVRVGQMATLDVVVSNRSGAPVTLTDVFIDGTSDFTVSPAGEQILSGNESQRFEVQFAPGARGEQAAVLRMPTDLSAPPELTVDLSGRGIAPVLTITPTSVDFGTVPVGFTAQQTITLANEGDAPLTIDAVTLAETPSPFALQNEGGSGTLDPGGAIDLSLRFVPAQVGDATNTLEVQSDDPLTPTQTASLLGTGATFADQTPPEAPLGIAAPVQLSVPDPFTPSSASVFFRRGGESTFQSAPLAPSGTKQETIYSGEIPAEFVTERGVQYYFSVSEGDRTVTLPANNAGTQPRQIRVTFDRIEAPVSLQAEQYRQVTIPVAFNASPTVVSLFEDDFGPYDPDVWRLLRWNVEEGAYRETPNLGEQYQVGKGFWLITAEPQSFDIDVADGRSVDANTPVTVPLPPGCTQVGTPFAFPVAWNDVIIEGNAEAIDEPIAREGTEATPEGTEWVPRTVLEPWTGYFVCNNGTDAATLRIPPREASVAAREQAARPFAQRLVDHGTFVVQLRAEVPSKGWHDTQNFLILASASDTESTGLPTHWTEPPPVEEPFALSIMEHRRPHLAVAKSIASAAGGQSWDVVLRAAAAPTAHRQRWPVTLTAATFGERPPGYRLVILDRDEGRIVERSEGAWTVMLDAQRPERRLRVTLGSEAFTTAQGLPFQEPGLLPGYPNPFSDVVHLSYRLPESQSMYIQVFDLLGRHIRTLVSGSREAGHHTVSWDGRDDAGRRVASGTYLCRMRAGEHVSVQTLVVTR